MFISFICFLSDKDEHNSCESWKREQEMTFLNKSDESASNENVQRIYKVITYKYISKDLQEKYFYGEKEILSKQCY